MMQWKAQKMKLTIEFDESGGYDSMYGAWIIRANGEALVEVDLQNFEQGACDYEFRSSEAETVARVILRALHAHYANQFGSTLVSSAEVKG